MKSKLLIIFSICVSMLYAEDNFRTRFNYDALGRITCITYPDGEQVMYSYIAGRLSRISSGNNTYLSEIKYNPYEKPICYHFGNGYTTEYTYDSTRLWMTRQKNYNANYLLQDLRYVYDAIGNIHYIEQIADSVGWLGGEYILDYQYDSLSRLIRTDMSSHYFGNYANYNMTYSSSGLVGEKRCNDMPWDYQYGYKFNSNGYLQNHQLQCIYDNITGENTALQWDANGQLLNILRPCQGDTRHHWWDEQGHLAAFVDNEQCGYYGYDGNGERVYKLTGQALLDQYNAGEPNFQMYFRDAVLYVNPYMVVTPRGYTKHYYNGNQRIAARIGKLEDFPDDIIVNSDTVAVERINNVREYMTSLLNTLDMQDVDTTGIIADIAGNSISGEQCDYIQTFHTSMHCDSNILYPILSKNSTEADVVDGMYFYHSDHLGSATWITNSVGTPVEYIHYMPYGELWVDQQATGYSERFKFTSKERDSESGYDYFGARYYSSTLPMWLSVDPLSDKYPHISPYAYCSWNPVNKIDPNGMWIESAWDAANVVIGVNSLMTNIQEHNIQDAVIDGAGLILDVAAVILPVVPGGASTAIKTARVANNVSDVVNVTTRTATKHNYRKVLQETTGKVGDGFDAHHTLPQKYRKQFEALDINIDEPGNVVWRKKENHRKQNYQHTKKWDDVMNDPANHSQEKIYELREQIELDIFENLGDTPLD